MAQAKEIKMEKYVPKDGDMSVFPNDKEGNEARPDFTGKVLIEGKEYRVALWNQVSQGGKEYMRGKASLPDAQYSQGGGASSDTPVPF